jgi:glycine/D-amino acid oxidase-like deaminating enzyme
VIAAVDTEVDVVVIGGGIQGLLVLDALIERRYSCALVTNGDLGAGQTLHSHGFLNTGFGMFGPELARAAADVVQPYLRARGVEVTGEWAVIPPPGLSAFENFPVATLPEGFDTANVGPAVRVPDRSLQKRRLVEMLIQGRRDRVLRGHASLHRSGTHVDTVTVGVDETSEVALATKAVVVAAGCGTKRLLSSLVGETAQLENIKHRRVNMICVRAPRGALPAISVLAMPLGLMIAAHETENDVTWYVTPMEFGGPSYDDIPDDAAADVDANMIARGGQALLTLYPRLTSVGGLEIGCYAGFRQDIGDQPVVPLCEVVHGTDNVVVALPSGLIAPWLNAARTVKLLTGLVDPNGSQSPIPCGGVGVQVGSVVEGRPDFEWMTWARWSGSFVSHQDPEVPGQHQW